MTFDNMRETLKKLFTKSNGGVLAQEIVKCSPYLSKVPSVWRGEPIRSREMSGHEKKVRERIKIVKTWLVASCFEGVFFIIYTCQKMYR